MEFKESEYSNLKKWLTLNSGKIFRVEGSSEWGAYYDAEGRLKKLESCGAKDLDKMVFYLKYHIIEGGKPNVEFLDEKLTKFKIWDDGFNFFNHPIVYQEKNIKNVPTEILPTTSKRRC